MRNLLSLGLRAPSAWFNKQKQHKAALLFILLGTFFTYFGSLNTIFILDDWPNLTPLSSLSKQSLSLTALIEFLANNRSGELGRPVSLLSFALQADAWPNNPAAFKAVNLTLHLLNGLAIFLICRRLMRIRSLSETEKNWLPLAVCGLWLVHPIHVCTVLYAVQRMTLLMSFFSLYALVGYLHGRETALRQTGKGYWQMGLSVFAVGTLAVFSKENGVLIMLYLAALEYTLLADQPAPRHWYWVRLCFLTLPIAGAAAYVLLHLPDFAAGHAGRPFTLTQHLLTECRILLEYLHKILLPHPNAFGLFFDDYPISTSLTAPPSTWIAVLSIAALWVTAFWLRHKQPVFSFAIAWFFAGHTLESSVIPLELYFEHRNYLPSFGILLALCYYFTVFLKQASSRTVKKTFLTLAVVYCVGIWLIGWQEVKLWANPAQQALTWQKNHPSSRRANGFAYQAWLHLNDPLKADSHLQNIATIDPKDNASYLLRLEMHCSANHLSKEERQQFFARLKHTQSDNATAMAAKNLVETWITGQCPHLDIDYTEQILQLVLQQTSDEHLSSHITSTLSLLYAAAGKYPQTFELLDNAIKRMPNQHNLRLLKIRWAITNKQYTDALTWIADARNQVPTSMLNKINYLNQLDIMEREAQQLQSKPPHIDSP